MADTELTGRSDAVALGRVASNLMARSITHVGGEPARIVDQAIDVVRALGDRGFSAGDLQVTQMHVARDLAGTELIEDMTTIDEMDRCMLMRQVTRVIAGAGAIGENEAAFLESMGRMLQLSRDQVEHVAIGVLEELSVRE